MSVSKLIESFYSNALSEDTILRKYLRLSPGGIHDYYVLPTKPSIKYLANIIEGEGYKRTIGSLSLRLLSSAPRTVAYLPYIDRKNLSVGTEHYPELVVVSDHIRMISRSQGVVHSLPYHKPDRIRQELETRLMLPESICTPELVDWDLKKPYFTETFVQGGLVGPPTKNWHHYQEAFSQLVFLYDSTSTEKMETDEWIETTVQKLSKTPLSDDFLNEAIQFINDLEIPNTFRKSRIHGDLNQRNLLSTKDGICILDWEDSVVGLPTVDFLRPFLIQYYDSRNADPFLQMLESEEPGIGYVQSFVESVGPIMYDESRWYAGLLPMTILECLVDIDVNDDLWGSVRELLQILIRY